MIDHEKSIQALAHVNAERSQRPGVPLVKLVDEAALRFDLDAGQSEWLLRTALAPAPGEAGSARTTCPTCGGELQEAEGVAGHLTCALGHLVSRRHPG